MAGEDPQKLIRWKHSNNNKLICFHSIPITAMATVCFSFVIYGYKIMARVETRVKLAQTHPFCKIATHMQPERFRMYVEICQNMLMAIVRFAIEAYLLKGTNYII